MASKNKKIAAAVTAVTLAVTLAVGGTFAWQSISQEATNIVTETVNPGGRLHNDFDGEAELNVYAENFGDQNIYARVQLSEYLEVGEAAGNAEDVDREVDVLVGGSKENINVYDQYEVYKYGAENTSDEYWDKSWGGSTLYIPTFDMNQDSLEPDLNGTYGYVNPDTQEKDPYGDFVDINETYHVDDPVTGSEVVDADANDEDEGTNAAEGTNIKITADQIHNVAQSLTAEVISMSDWLNNYYDYETESASDFTGWVYDEDGWAYWSQPIEPGTATGLLYDGISDLGYIDDDYFYDIHVKGQFITKGDIGSDDGTGFYDTAAGPEPTAEALMLLKAIGVNTGDTAGGEEGGNNSDAPLTISVIGGEAITPGASTWIIMEGYSDINNVEYSVSGNSSSATTVDIREIEGDTNLLLEIGDDETVDKYITVTVTDTFDGEEASVSLYITNKLMLSSSGENSVGLYGLNNSVTIGTFDETADLSSLDLYYEITEYPDGYEGEPQVTTVNLTPDEDYTYNTENKTITFIGRISAVVNVSDASNSVSGRIHVNIGEYTVNGEAVENGEEITSYYDSDDKATYIIESSVSNVTTWLLEDGSDATIEGTTITRVINDSDGYATVIGQNDDGDEIIRFTIRFYYNE